MVVFAGIGIVRLSNSAIAAHKILSEIATVVATATSNTRNRYNPAPKQPQTAPSVFAP